MPSTDRYPLSTDHLIIHTDGGSRGNPGPAATGIVIYNSHYELIHKFGRCIGINTNNVAEYTAVLDALTWLLTFEPPARQRTAHSFEPPEPPALQTNLYEPLRAVQLNFKLDSQLVVEQLSGHWKIKDQNLAAIAAKIRSLLADHFPLTTFTYVPRSQNAAADAEVNLALDAQNH